MKKFLLNIDGSPEQFLYSLFFCHIVNNEFSDVEFNCLCPEGDYLDYSKLSPFEMNVYRYAEKELSSIPKTHKFAFNLHDIFNVDYFIDFDETVTSAFIGTAFKAKERFGFSSRMRNLILTKSFDVKKVSELFDGIVDHMGLSFDLDVIKKDFEIIGDDILISMTELAEEKLNQIKESLTVHHLNEEGQFTEEFLGKLDSVEFVLTTNHNEIGIYNYLNKTVIIDQEENETNEDSLISLETFLKDYLIKSD